MLAQFAKMAREDQSPLVRLYLASALQRVPADEALGRARRHSSRTPRTPAITTCR